MPKLMLSIAVAAIAASTLFAQAAEPGKETPPAGGAPKPFRVPRTEEFSLTNGLKVTLIPYGLIPKVTAELVIRGGEITEPSGKDGVASLLADLMKEGTATRSSQQFAEQTARLGGTVNITADADEIAVTGEGLSDYAPDLVALIADIALHAKLPDTEVPRLKQDLLRNLTLARSNSPAIAGEEFHKLLYGADNGYGRTLPSEASVKTLTIEDIRAFYGKHFVAANAHLYVSGVLSGALRPAIEKAFAGWVQGAKPEVPTVKAQTNRTLELIDRPNSPQSTLYVGLPVADARSQDAVPLAVTQMLLGGSFMSRITSNIREQKGYTYSPHAQYERRVGNGVWMEIADVTTAVTGASLKEIFGEVDRLRKEAPPAAELQGIESQISGGFVLQNSSRQGIIGQLRFVRLHDLPADYLDTYVAKVNAVKPADVQALTEKYIVPDKMTVVVVGDKAKITEQVAPYRPAAK